MIIDATIIQVNPGNLLIMDASSGQEVMVHFRDSNTFSAGDNIRITYDGKMTRSIPPQISADSILRIHPAAQTDFGPSPFVVDIKKDTICNGTFRTALWTGTHLQLTLMSIPVGGDIGLEAHPHVDQFLRIEDGQGLTMMGNSRDYMHIRQPVFDDFAIFVPAGTWHNVINTGNKPLKLYSIYAPPNHLWGTVHQTKEIADEAESNSR